jgi:hypothetical protein
MKEPRPARRYGHILLRKQSEQIRMGVGSATRFEMRNTLCAGIKVYVLFCNSCSLHEYRYHDRVLNGFGHTTLLLIDSDNSRHIAWYKPTLSYSDIAKSYQSFCGPGSGATAASHCIILGIDTY